MSFFGDLIGSVTRYSGYISMAIDILTAFFKLMEPVVEYVVDRVNGFMDKVESGEVSGDEARETIVKETMTKFSGSQPITEQDVRTIVEQSVKVLKAKRNGEDAFIEKEQQAIGRGYVKSDDLALARKGYKNLLPVD